MALKDVWAPQNETMDAIPEIPNMLADAIIKNEADIKKLQENGSSGGSELFVIQWDGTTGDKTYQEVSDAIKEHKIPALYQEDRCIATLNRMIGNDVISFASFDIDGVSEVIEYFLNGFDGTWYVARSSIVNSNNLNEYISANNETFKTAVLNCFPDADTMSFPLKETVSEVSGG